MAVKDQDKRKYIRYSEMLGMPLGTARARLVKAVLFRLVKSAGENFCYRCSAEIESVSALSIDHTKDWLEANNPAEAFFCVDDIGFSHLRCNTAAPMKKRQKFASREEKVKHHTKLLTQRRRERRQRDKQPDCP